VTLIDNPPQKLYPLQIDTEFEDNVLVGRVRADLSNPKAFGMWIVANNLRKGAALNAVQILEACVSL
jgi:aspartate-semialdehyde dehydrogenase